jgi:hypothetical protein
MTAHQMMTVQSRSTKAGAASTMEMTVVPPRMARMAGLNPATRSSVEPECTLAGSKLAASSSAIVFSPEMAAIGERLRRRWVAVAPTVAR